MFHTRPVHGGNVVWAAQVANCSPSDLLDFSASISPLGPPQSAIAAIQASFNQLASYPSPGYDRLRQALAQHHGVSADWVIPGNGAAELLTWAGRDLAVLDATYLITPAFGDYWRSLNAFNAIIVPCRLPLAAAEAGSVDWLTVIASGLQRDPERCGLLLNTPHNPTGLVIPLETLTTLLSQFALVVVDEAFMDFLPPDSHSSLIHQRERWPNLVVLRSLTKFYSLPGLRVGYAIAHPDRLYRWRQWRDPWPVNTLAVEAATAVLQDQDYQTRSWHWLASARDTLLAQLRTLPGLHPFPGQANYLLIRTERPGPQVQDELLKQHRILVRDCLSFPELGEQYIRVAVRTEAENARLCQALATVI
ncbi:MAG: threonine-phosphate decarboxylase [Leptolyngbya sp. SIO1E4]|nr:threonine-phosphate decarboxylase [Leptolyngbya sp. SIO1E4]